MAEKKSETTTAPEEKAEKVTIHYELDLKTAPGNPCKATATFKGADLSGYGPTWGTARKNLLDSVAGLKAVPETPEDEEVSEENV